MSFVSYRPIVDKAACERVCIVIALRGEIPATGSGISIGISHLRQPLSL